MLENVLEFINYVPFFFINGFIKLTIYFFSYHFLSLFTFQETKTWKWETHRSYYVAAVIGKDLICPMQI